MASGWDRIDPLGSVIALRHLGGSGIVAKSAPTERILALAAYVKAQRDRQVTLGDITRDVPGYDAGTAPRDGHGELVAGTPEWEALRKKVARDLRDLADSWGAHVDCHAA